MTDQGSGNQNTIPCPSCDGQRDKHRNAWDDEHFAQRRQAFLDAAEQVEIQAINLERGPVVSLRRLVQIINHIETSTLRNAAQELRTAAEVPF